MSSGSRQRFSIALVILVVSVAMFGCSRQSVTPDHRIDAARRAPVSFVNRVWRVTRSSDVAEGTLYVFLSEGTLLITSSHGTPAVGSWKYEGSTLLMIEEGLPYHVDIVRLTDVEFSITSHNSGKPVEITFVPAEGLPLPK